MNGTREGRRLADGHAGRAAWLRWGPYLADRQWGTVREDDSSNGDPWHAFTHDQARSRAYRWGEDGIAGLTDDGARLCFSLALWNGVDPIVKERLFGLANDEGNHGEDVKELYWYLDATPTHSWARMRYRYPQRAYPYDDLVRINGARSRQEPEYEIWDTGVFDDRRFFDVDVDYAKASPDDILIRVTVHNRGPEAAELHLLPMLWFRNTWAGAPDWAPPQARPSLRAESGGSVASLVAEHVDLGRRRLLVEGPVSWLVTENETNTERLWGIPNASAYVRDGINDAVVHGRTEAVNPAGTGTRAAAHRVVSVPAGRSVVMRLRLTADDPSTAPWAATGPFGEPFDRTMRRRESEADAFYASITPPSVSAERASILRQALAGMLWSKQHYSLDMERWLASHPAGGSDAARLQLRNADWSHLINDEVISMPDTWEYPWYAAWDLAIHTVALDMVDPDFARGQLDLMLRELYQHPNGQLPAYEWNFGDVNPPVHAWAVLFAYSTARKGGDADAHPDIEFLERAFQKLLLSFTWWINRKDPDGRNIYNGGFLGLDNIGVFDRSAPVPSGGRLEQADGTAWMALFSQNMLEIALELATHDRAYEPMAAKFVQHFLWIASAMDREGDRDDELWDEEDGFFYDLVRMPDGSAQRLKVRSYVGILPLCAVTVIPEDAVTRFPDAMARIRRFLASHPDLAAAMPDTAMPGVAGRRILAILDERKLRRVLARVLDPAEFYSPFGVRSLSKAHEGAPFELRLDGQTWHVAYEPAESTTGMFGGNSNWRGPVWFPINLLIVRALLQYYLYYGDGFRVECPVGSGRMLTLFEVARDLADRLIAIFERGADGRRPVHGDETLLQEDPDLADAVLFYEYFHGDTGAGLGASHQTGWTGTVARLIQLFGHLDAAEVLQAGGRPITRTYGHDAAASDDAGAADDELESEELTGL